MTQDRYVLGMDSGGSKTLLLLVRSDGEVLACARGRGVANLSNDPAAIAEVLSPIVREALSQLEGESSVCAAYGCLGGLNPDAVEAGLKTILGRDAVWVRRESSGEVVFTSAGFWGFDIAVMAGTGSIALGINPDGERRVVGGWGSLIHDRGSGHTVGRHALQALAETLDFRGDRTALLPALARTAPFEAHMPRDLDLGMPPREMTYEQRLAIKEAIKRTYPELDRPTIASMFRLVVCCAEEGDRTALDILFRAGRDLAHLACALADELDLTEPTVLAMGGVFDGGACILDPFRDAIQERYPAAVVRQDDFQLVIGAGIVALQRAGAAVDERVVSRLRQSAARHLA